MKLTGLSILLIEDDPVFRTVVAQFLIKKGASVKEASDGLKGLCFFEHYDFDIVLINISIPKSSGTNFLKKILFLSPKIKILVISGNMQVTKALEALKAGAVDYLVKPISNLQSIEDAILQSNTN